MLELFEHVEDDDSARMLALTGAGAAFCTGFDAAVDPRLVESLAVLSKPTVAIINGDAFDEGLELAMAADIRVAISSARFAITQIKRGAMPHFGATQRLPRLIGAANALRLMLTGTALGADDAMRIGLVTYLAGSPRRPRRRQRPRRRGYPEPRSAGRAPGQRRRSQGLRHDFGSGHQA